MKAKNEILVRLAVVYIAVFLFALMIVFKLLFIQVFQGKKYKEMSAETTRKIRPIESARGNIYSSDGRLMAISVPYYMISMDLRSDGLTDKIFNNSIDSLGLCLSSLFKDQTAQEYVSMLKKARRENERYLTLQKKVDYSYLNKLKQFPIFRLGRNKGGLIIEPFSKRVLPNRLLAARTLGYLLEEGSVVGIEGAYNKILSGTNGFQLMQKLSGGVWMPVDDDHKIDPADGKDIVTTIDLNLQDVAESSLMNQLIALDADHGTAVLMEVSTGDIKAIANLGKDKDGVYREVFNYAIGESAEPGSTFKLASMIALFEDGLASPNDIVDTKNGQITYNGFTIRDSKEEGYGKITLEQAFEYSSNVGISQVIYRNYSKNPQKFIDRLASMNLTKKLGLEIKGETSPYINSPKDSLWSSISLAQISIGYEVQMTPLQTLTFYNAVANNGIMVKPRFVKEIKQYSQVLESMETEIINPKICSDATVKKVKRMLIGVVENGTAKNIKDVKLKIAGKTGTAQIAKTKYGYGNKYHGRSYQTSFVGFFPADNPKYSCIVVINAPQTNKYGALAAAPVFRDIANKVYASVIDIHKPINADGIVYFDIPYSKSGYKSELEYIFKQIGVQTKFSSGSNSDWVITNTKNKYVEYQRKSVQQNIVPKVEGMGARDAIYLLESIGLEVSIKGYGVVTKQSLNPGTKCKKGDKILIELS